MLVTFAEDRHEFVDLTVRLELVVLLGGRTYRQAEDLLASTLDRCVAGQSFDAAAAAAVVRDVAH